MQQQQQQQMMPMMASFPPTNITTEQIQKYLDDNKKLILAILDNQNLGKLAECAQYQAQLQKNLMYLAAIADAQPQAPTLTTQMTSHPAMQQGLYYMQHPQASGMPQHGALFAPKMPMQFNAHLLQDPQQLQQALQQSQLGMRPMVPNHDMYSMHPTVVINKQDASEAVSVGAEGKSDSVIVHGDGREIGK